MTGPRLPVTGRDVPHENPAPLTTRVRGGENHSHLLENDQLKRSQTRPTLEMAAATRSLALFQGGEIGKMWSSMVHAFCFAFCCCRLA